MRRWCANTTQYLPDAELAQALSEFRRVVRSGGLVALKDSDALHRIEPTPAYFMQRFTDAHLMATEKFGYQAAGAYCGPTLLTWLCEAGFEPVWARTTLIERWLGCDRWNSSFGGRRFGFFAGQALQLDLPAVDPGLWREPSDTERVADFVAQPSFCAREGNIVADGRVV